MNHVGGTQSMSRPRIPKFCIEAFGTFKIPDLLVLAFFNERVTSEKRCTTLLVNEERYGGNL